MIGVRCLLVGSVLLLSPAPKADNWDTYAQWWSSHYYEYDSKAFTSISCRVDSSLLDDGVAGLLAGHASVVAAKELYTVSVSNTGDVEVSDPPLQLRPVTPSAEVEVPLIQEMLQSRFTQLSAGTDHDIKAVVQNFTPPSRKSELIQAITIGPVSTVVTKKSLDADNTSKVTFRGADYFGESTQSMKFSADTLHAQIAARAHFDMVDGKYLLASEEDDSMQSLGARRIHAITRMSVEYQIISGIRFPKTATWSNEPGSDIQGYDEILEFEDCKVTK
jgi:hypothetical protein